MLNYYFFQNSLSKKSTAGQRRHVYSDIKELRKDLRVREEKATKSVLQNAQVILSTLNGATNDGPLKLLDTKHFDMAIIDECSQVRYYLCF